MAQITEDDLDRLATRRGVRRTHHREVVADILSRSRDHPTAEEILARARKVEPGLSLATVYRAVTLFKKAGLVDQHDFGDGKARFEVVPDDQHDHLIDAASGEVIEFCNAELDALLEKIATEHGYTLQDRVVHIHAVKHGEEQTQDRNTFYRVSPR
ncbi:MAG: Fur family transcriptional regulator [Pseudomonadota bacterium]